MVWPWPETERTSWPFTPQAILCYTIVEWDFTALDVLELLLCRASMGRSAGRVIRAAGMDYCVTRSRGINAAVHRLNGD